MSTYTILINSVIRRRRRNWRSTFIPGNDTGVKQAEASKGEWERERGRRGKRKVWRNRRRQERREQRRKKGG